MHIGTLLAYMRNVNGCYMRRKINDIFLFYPNGRKIKHTLNVDMQIYNVIVFFKPAPILKQTLYNGYIG